MVNTIELPIDLGASGYVRFVGRVSEGHLATTFLALVSYRGSIRRAYIKLYDHAEQPRAVLNEVLGYLYSQAMDMPSPPVFFVEVPAFDVVASGFRMSSAGAVRAVGTLEAHEPKMAGEGTAKTLYAPNAMTQIKSRLIASPAGRTLMSFDEALGNADRNTGNIVFSRKHGVVAIDHGCILTGPIWSRLTLNASFDQRNIVFDILDQTPIGESDKSALLAAGQVMLETYYERLAELMTALSHPADSDLVAAFDFVWWKALRLNERLATMLKVIS
jgi:hypothetical protein